MTNPPSFSKSLPNIQIVDCPIIDNSICVEIEFDVVPYRAHPLPSITFHKQITRESYFRCRELITSYDVLCNAIKGITIYINKEQFLHTIKIKKLIRNAISNAFEHYYQSYKFVYYKKRYRLSKRTKTSLFPYKCEDQLDTPTLWSKFDIVTDHFNVLKPHDVSQDFRLDAILCRSFQEIGNVHNLFKRRAKNDRFDTDLYRELKIKYDNEYELLDAIKIKISLHDD